MSDRRSDHGSIDSRGLTLHGDGWDLLMRAGSGGWHELILKGLNRPMYVRFGQSVDGRLICTGLIAGPLLDPREVEIKPLEGEAMPALLIQQSMEVELTARDLRRIPLGAVVASVGEQSWDPGSPLHQLLPFLGKWSTPVSGVKLRPGPDGHPDEHFKAVAEAYRAAREKSPRRPIKTLSEQFHASEATIRRWVQRARDKGLLRDSVPGRLGERREVTDE